MPKIDNIEETPNPNAVKFVLKEPVSNGAARSFNSVKRVGRAEAMKCTVWPRCANSLPNSEPTMPLPP